MGTNVLKEGVKMKENVVRMMGNMSRTPAWNGTLSVDEVNYWLENYSDVILCNGRPRKVVFDKITDKTFKVYSVPS